MSTAVKIWGLCSQNSQKQTPKTFKRGEGVEGGELILDPPMFFYPWKLWIWLTFLVNKGRVSLKIMQVKAKQAWPALGWVSATHYKTGGSIVTAGSGVMLHGELKLWLRTGLFPDVGGCRWVKQCKALMQRASRDEASSSGVSIWGIPDSSYSLGQRWHFVGGVVGSWDIDKWRWINVIVLISPT